MDLRELLIRNDALTPRLENIRQSQDLEGLDFEPGEIERAEPPEIDERVSRANIIRQILGVDVNIEHGRAESDNEAGWYSVEFDEAFNGPPTVIAIAERRSGSLKTKNFSSPEHESPDFTTETESIRLQTRFEESFKETSRTAGGRMFDRVRSTYQSILPSIGGVDLSDPFVRSWDIILQETMGKGDTEASGEGTVESAMGFLGAQIGSAIDDAFRTRGNEIRRSINNVVNSNMFSYNSNINSAYNNLSGQAENALNESNKLLYESLGVPEGELITPIQIRNATTQGFEFLGYEGGVTIHWVALGE